MKSLHQENARLKRIYADLSLKREVLQNVMSKKILMPYEGKQMDKDAASHSFLNIRQACAAFMISPHCYRYSPCLSDGSALICDWLGNLCKDHPRWGFGLCFAYLRNIKGFVWNHKCVYWLYCEMALNDKSA